jgi:hypothetical protein
LWRRHGEHDARDVHPGSRAGDLAQFEALDEESRNYVHCDKPVARVRVRVSSDKLWLGLALIRGR